MIVVAIVGVLASIAVPGYRRYVERAREAGAVVHLYGISMALKSVMVDDPFLLPDNTAAFTAFCRSNDLPILDPWGNPYVYFRIYGRSEQEIRTNARKNKRDHPLNSDFDLYSKGANGNSNKPLTSGPSQDDILRANDGAFIGRASTYTFTLDQDP